MRRFGVLLRKELKELATLQMLAPFALTMLVFVLIGNVVGAQGAEAERTRSLSLLDLDRTPASALVAESAEQSGFSVVEATAGEPEAVLADESQPAVLLVVPEGFEESLQSGERAQVQTYTAIRSFSIMGSRESAALAGALAALSQQLQAQLVGAVAPGADASVIAQPLAVTEHVVLGDRQADVGPDAVMGFITSQTTFIPIVVFLVIVFAAQMVANAVASEKENKTLETLLAMPVSRSAIVTTKMMAAAAIALVSAGAYMFGMNYYITGLTEGFGGSEATAAQEAAAEMAQQLGLTLSVGDYALLGLTLFFSILVALAIALILGAFAENVKAVQSLLAPMMILIMVPYFMSMFVDIGSLPTVARLALFALPFTHTFTAAPNLFLGNVTAVLAGIVYQAVWFVALVIVAARIFSSDRLLTMRLNLSRKRSRTPAAT